MEKVAISQDEAILKALDRPLHNELAEDLIERLSDQAIRENSKQLIERHPYAYAKALGNKGEPVDPEEAQLLAERLIKLPSFYYNVFEWLVNSIPDKKVQQDIYKDFLINNETGWENGKGEIIRAVEDVGFLKSLLRNKEWKSYWKEIKTHLIVHLDANDVELTPHEQLSDREIYERSVKRIQEQKSNKKSSLIKISISEEEAILKALEKPLHVSVATNLLRRLSKEVIMKYLERILPIHTESFFDIMFDVGFSPEQFKEIAERALRMSPFPSAILASIVMHFEKDKEYSNYLANETLKHIPRSSKYGIFLVLQLTDAEQVYSYMGELRHYGTYWKHLIELGGEPMIKKLMHDEYVEKEDKFNYMVGQYENAIKEATPDFLDWLKTRMSDRPNLFKAHILKYIKLIDAPEEEKKKLFEKYLPDSHWDPWILGSKIEKQAISQEEAILKALESKDLHPSMMEELLRRLGNEGILKHILPYIINHYEDGKDRYSFFRLTDALTSLIHKSWNADEVLAYMNSGLVAPYEIEVLILERASGDKIYTKLFTEDRWRHYREALIGNASWHLLQFIARNEKIYPEDRCRALSIILRRAAPADSWEELNPYIKEEPMRECVEEMALELYEAEGPDKGPLMTLLENMGLSNLIEFFNKINVKEPVKKQAISSDEAILNALGKKPHVEVAKGLLDRISDSNKKIDAIHVIEETYPEIQNAVALIDHLIYNVDRDLWGNRYQEFNNSKFDIKNLIQEWVTNAVALEILKNKAWWQVAEHLIYKRRDYNDFMQRVLFDKEIGITSRDFAYQYLSDDDKRVILPELVDRDIDYIKYKVKSPLGFKLLWDDIDNLNLPFEQSHISEKVLSVTPEDVKKSIFVDQPYLVRKNPETKASVNVSAISRDEAIVKSLERPLSDEVALGLIQELSVKSFKENIEKIFPLYPDEALSYMRQATSLKGVDPSEFFLDVDFLKRVLDKKYEEELGSHQVGISYDITSKRNYQVNKELAKDPNILMESRLDFFNHLPDRLREEAIWEADDYGALEFLSLIYVRRKFIENGFMNTLARSHPSANVRQYAEGLLETFKKEEGHGSKR